MLLLLAFMPLAAAEVTDNKGHGAIEWSYDQTDKKVHIHYSGADNHGTMIVFATNQLKALVNLKRWDQTWDDPRIVTPGSPDSGGIVIVNDPSAVANLANLATQSKIITDENFSGDEYLEKLGLIGRTNLHAIFIKDNGEIMFSKVSCLYETKEGCVIDDEKETPLITQSNNGRNQIRILPFGESPEVEFGTFSFGQPTKTHVYAQIRGEMPKTTLLFVTNTENQKVRLRDLPKYLVTESFTKKYWSSNFFTEKVHYFEKLEYPNGIMEINPKDLGEGTGDTVAVLIYNSGDCRIAVSAYRFPNWLVFPGYDFVSERI